jgi:hypothetical protein
MGTRPEVPRPQPDGGDGWSRLKRSPLFPAVVVSLLVATLAGLFVGAYSWGMANPVPHRIPVAVTGGSDRGERFIDALENAMRTSLELHQYPTYAAARASLDEQQNFAILQRRANDVEVDVAGAAGASVARVLGQTAQQTGSALGIPVQVRDLKPLPVTDPQGIAIFYVSLGSIILGFVGAIQLGVHAADINCAERIAFTAGYALLGGLAICAMVDWVLRELPLPFAQSWAICAVSMFTSGMIYTAFQTFLGRWAVLATWLLMVVLGNPSSGGAVAWPLLPPVLGFLGRFLPPGASVSAQRNAIYFQHNQHLEPYAVLIGWCLASTLAFVVWHEVTRVAAQPASPSDPR